MRALNRFRLGLHYRRDRFDAGLKRAGYQIVDSIRDPKPDDLLLIWNRYGHYNEEAKRFEAGGATVVVAENGYLGKNWRGGEWFALSRGHHNGAGWWPDGGPERWDSLGVELAPWRTGGDEVVVLPQRGIGERGVAMPRDWPQRNYGRIRRHPGTTNARPLEDDLARAKYVVTWASGAALKALVLGIPVYYEFPKWIGAPACRHVSEIGSEPKRSHSDRMAMFRRLAWAMWEMTEIESGEPFRRLTG